MPAPRRPCCPWLPPLLSRSRLFSQSHNAAPNRVNHSRYTQSPHPRSTLFRGGGASGCPCGQERQALVHRCRQVVFHHAGEPNFHWSGQPPASRLGRVALVAYHPPRGQVAFPASAAQLNVRRRRWRRAFKSASSPSSRLAHAVSASLLPSFTACAPACSSCCCCASRLMHPPRLARPRIQAGAHLWRICPCSAAGRAAPGSAVLRGFTHHLRRVRRALTPPALGSTPLSVRPAGAFFHRHA